jgi:2'-5' RNA ligase
MVYTLAMLVVTIKPPRQFASTQFNLSEDAADIVRSWAYHHIPDEDLAPEAGEKIGTNAGDSGREREPHITVRYGFHEDHPQEAARLVRDFGPVKVRVGKVSIFEAPDFDVIKLDIRSAALRRLNRLLAKFPHTDTHKTYTPHMTLAYARKGSGKKYVGMDCTGMSGQPLTFDHFIWSGKDRHCYVIPLTGRPRARMFKATRPKVYCTLAF